MWLYRDNYEDRSLALYHQLGMLWLAKPGSSAKNDLPSTFSCLKQSPIRVHAHQDWAPVILLLAIERQFLGKCMTIGHLDPGGRGRQEFQVKEALNAHDMPEVETTNLALEVSPPQHITAIQTE